jgi:hypothetical protein
MSNIGIILDQYEVLVKTTQRINDSIIVFKKQFLLLEHKGQYQDLVIRDEELKNAKTNLSQFISYLSGLKDENKKPDFEIVPKRVFEKFKKLVEEISNIDNDLRSIQKRIKGGQSLLKNQFLLLDKIVAILDMERGVLFKTLRTARG